MQDSHDCLNCGAAARLNFCPNCGQETRAHVPSAREFIHEFATHYVAIEGKLWRTLRLLLLKPGRLTTEYIAGRRASYVNPLRVFLTFSILFFATLKLSGQEIAQVGTTEPPPAEQVAGPDTVRDRDEAGAGEAGRAGSEDKEFTALSEFAARLGPTVSQNLERFKNLPNAEKNRVISSGFLSYAPYAMFLLMPIFALYLKLLYLGTGRRYGEHFLFALHTNAFAYLQITLIMLSPWGWLSFLLVLWLLFYLPLAMQRVYGGARAATFLRWLVLGFLHLMSLAFAVVVALVLPMIS